MALTQATFLQLVTRLANDLDDLVELAATTNGTTTTFVDTVNINANTRSYEGWEFWGTSAPNAGVVATVDGISVSTIVLTPAMTSTQSGNTAILVNKLGRGFRIQDYKRAINAAITDFNGVGRIETIETIVAAFDASDGTIAVPATMAECYRVEYQDADGIWCEIRKATPLGGYGWTAEPANAVIRIEGNAGWNADGYAVRLHGYKFQDALSAQTDVCYFDPSGIVARAAYYLLKGGTQRNSDNASKVLLYQEESEKMLRRAKVTRKSGTVTVRF